MNHPEFFCRLRPLIRLWPRISIVFIGIVVLLNGCRYRQLAIEPAELLPTLPVPYTKPAAGTVPYGSAIRFRTDSLPKGSTIEYSIDNGQHWQSGDSLTLRTGATLLFRSRQGPYVSAVGTASFAVGFKRVLLVGNSITLHAPSPEIGWLGNWGMAASAPGNDYTHILTKRLQSLDSQVVVKVYDGVGFESQFWTFDYQAVRSASAFKPDLVVMRIGENVPVAAVTTRNFKQYYQRLIDSLTVNQAPVKIVCTTSFFDQPTTSNSIRQAAAERNYYLADLSQLVDDRSMRAIGLFKDPSVAAHPGDKGMLTIADLIWDKVH